MTRRPLTPREANAVRAAGHDAAHVWVDAYLLWPYLLTASRKRRWVEHPRAARVQDVLRRVALRDEREARGW